MIMPTRGVVAAACITLAAAITGLATIAAAPARAATPPQNDPFYAAPSNLASVPTGSVLRSRPVTIQFGPVPALGSAFNAYQLLYRTDDATGSPVANVTTVVVPKGAAPAGGRKLVSLQDAEDSVDPDCAPSYQLQVGELAPNGDSNANLGLESSLMAAELAQGYDVVIPDAEGPKSEYIVTGMEGHATLDSIRAAERFAPAGLGGAGTQVGLVGYSGGASDTAAANELQPAYAPELNIVGVAAGGVPVGNEETVQYLDGSIGAGVLMAAAIGIDRAYPQLDLYSLLNARGNAFAQKVSTGCATSIFAAPYTNFNTWTTVPNAFELPRVQQIIATNALGHATPTAPTFYYNAINDELVWIKPLDQLVAYYCAHGARIDYLRDPLAQEHIEALSDFIPLAETYLDQRFAGDPVPDTCGAPANGSPTSGTGPGPGAQPRAGCPRATGRLRGEGLGLVKLGMTRAQARRAYKHSSNRGRRYEDFFCLTPIGVRVGYASPKLLRALPRHQRGRVRGRVVWASTSDPYYSLRAIRPGATLRTASRRLKTGRPFHVGRNVWYFAANGASTALLKVRRGIVEEIGIADQTITKRRTARLAFVRSFS